MGVQKHYQKRFANKQIVSKSFFFLKRQKIQSSKTKKKLGFVFMRFSVRGVQKHDKNIGKI
jgi:hypothetical protein